jgi:hypothetical protein
MEKNILVLLLAGVLTACVTINIYFPAAAAQEAADQIIDDVWKIKEGDAKAPSAASDTPTQDK